MRAELVARDSQYPTGELIRFLVDSLSKRMCPSGTCPRLIDSIIAVNVEFASNEFARALGDDETENRRWLEEVIDHITRYCTYWVNRPSECPSRTTLVADSISRAQRDREARSGRANRLPNAVPRAKDTLLYAPGSASRNTFKSVSDRIGRDLFSYEKAERAFYHDHGVFTDNPYLLTPYIRDLGLRIEHVDWDEIWIETPESERQRVEISLKQVGKMGISCGLWIEPSAAYTVECLRP